MFLNSTHAFKEVTDPSSEKHQDFLDIGLSNLINILILHEIVKFIARVFGIVTNILALVIFWKTGLVDGISVCFFSLTIADLFCLVTFLVATLLGILDLDFHVKPYVSLYWVSYMIPFYSLMFYNISIVTTVFLAIQKCCCVVMPLKFKDTFSRGRSIAVNVCIYCGISITFIPFTVSSLPFQLSFDTSTNSSRLVIYISDFYLTEIFPVLKAINYISIPIISEIVVLISTILLTVRLRQSLKFRRSVAGEKIGHKEITTLNSLKNRQDRFHSTSQNSKFHIGKDSLDLNTKSEEPNSLIVFHKQQMSDTKLSNSKNELRVAQAVNFVALKFVLFNSPNVAILLTSLVAPEFSGFGQYRYTYKLCLQLQDLLHVINMSVNMFVYLKFNSRFRKKFWSTFRFLSCGQEEMK